LWYELSGIQIFSLERQTKKGAKELAEDLG
jgi:hypothetical protein